MSRKKKKRHLVNWQSVCQPLEFGCDGFRSNICLLSRWLWRLETEEGILQTLLRNKYLRRVNVAQCLARPGQSHFWQGVMKAKVHFLKFCKRIFSNGLRTSFGEDLWLGNEVSWG